MGDRRVRINDWQVQKIEITIHDMIGYPRLLFSFDFVRMQAN